MMLISHCGNVIGKRLRVCSCESGVCEHHLNFVFTYSESIVTAKIYTACAKSNAVCSKHIAINMARQLSITVILFHHVCMSNRYIIRYRLLFWLLGIVWWLLLNTDGWADCAFRAQPHVQYTVLHARVITLNHWPNFETQVCTSSNCLCTDVVLFQCGKAHLNIAN